MKHPDKGDAHADEALRAIAFTKATTDLAHPHASALIYSSPIGAESRLLREECVSGSSQIRGNPHIGRAIRSEAALPHDLPCRSPSVSPTCLRQRHNGPVGLRSYTGGPEWASVGVADDALSSCTAERASEMRPVGWLVPGPVGLVEQAPAGSWTAGGIFPVIDLPGTVRVIARQDRRHHGAVIRLQETPQSGQSHGGRDT